MLLATALGLLLASVYRHTHKGLSYSQSFTLTIVFVTTIVAITLMAIESSLARAFALVGAMSIIRFRTVVKDTKDTAYVFAGLAVGMAAGTSSYFLALASGGFISLVAILLHISNFGAASKADFILRFKLDKNQESKYQDILKKLCKKTRLLHVEPIGNSQFLIMSYDISLKRKASPDKIAGELGTLKGISDISVIAAVTDVDY
jgi:uncharacterized membrane protein YhiD involved in acid resistance